MTFSITLSTVTNAIEGLTISGVTVCDIDEITTSRMGGKGILSPRPDNFVTGLSFTRDEISGQLQTVRYTLNYAYYHLPIGSVLNFNEYSTMITNIVAIAAALAEDHTITGSLDTNGVTVSDIGMILDPAGNAFHGCIISLEITQFLS
jgi:hypothetical protein